MCDSNLAATSITVTQLLSTNSSDSHFLLILNKCNCQLQASDPHEITGVAVKLKRVQPRAKKLGDPIQTESATWAIPINMFVEEQESEHPSWAAYDMVGLPHCRQDESAG